MILGHGIDVVDIARIRIALERPRTGERFRERVFTAIESEYCRRQHNAYESFAARFAAKEAVMKALGCACGWREIEVHRSDGEPSVRLHGRAARRAQQLGVRRIHLSLSHSGTVAMASVVAED